MTSKTKKVCEIIKCVQCGFCCKQRPCQWGEVTSNEEACEDLSFCRFLKTDDQVLGTYICLNWEFIERTGRKCVHTMCGSGCSSTLFNADRNAVMKKIAEMAVDRLVKPTYKYTCKNDRISCEICVLMHGKTVSKEIATSVIPPHHEGCRCTVEKETTT